MRRMAIAVCLTAWAGITSAADAAKAPKAPRTPAMEKLMCSTGPNDRQARLSVLMVKGRPMEFAYYTRLGTSVCSIHGRRGDAYTKWQDDGDRILVKLLEGTAMLEFRPGYLKIKFDDVDRMRYCGMIGELNGSIEVASKNSECALHGVFD